MANYPDIIYEYGPNYLKVPPITPSGFEVSLYKDRGNFIVFFMSWFEIFTDEEEALNYFAFGLSNSVRIKMFLKDNFAYKWSLEYFDEGDWHHHDTLTLPDYPLGNTSRVKYLSNHLIHDELPELVY